MFLSLVQLRREELRMKRLLFELLVVISVYHIQCEITYIEAKYPLKVSRMIEERSTDERWNFQGKRSAPNAVWPHPQQMNSVDDLLYIRPNNLPIYSNLQTCDIIAKAIERYRPILFPPTLDMHQPPVDTQNIFQNLTLNVGRNGQCEKYIELNSSEACE